MAKQTNVKIIRMTREELETYLHYVNKFQGRTIISIAFGHELNEDFYIVTSCVMVKSFWERLFTT